MYEAVHARPDGESTAARLALTAAEQGYEGVVVRNHTDARTDADLDAAAELAGIDVVPAAEIRAEGVSQASGHLGNLRRKVPLVAVHGGTPAINRFAVEQSRVDVLAHPTRGEDAIDHVVVKTAAEYDVALQFALGPVLRGDGGPRVQAIGALRRLRELVEHYDAPFVVSGDPASHLSLRAPRELIAVGEQIGFDRSQVEAGLARWGEIAVLNRRRLGDDVVEPGVEVGRFEETSMAADSDAGESVPGEAADTENETGGEGTR